LASLLELRALLGELRTVIQSHLPKRNRSCEMTSEDAERFWDAVRHVCERLNGVGHHLYQRSGSWSYPYEQNHESWWTMDDDTSQFGLQIEFFLDAVEVYWTVGRKYRDCPFVVGRRYRVRRDFKCLRDEFTAGEVLEFAGRLRNFDNDAFAFTQNEAVWFEPNLPFGAEGGSRVWDVPDHEELQVWTDLFELVD